VAGFSTQFRAYQPQIVVHAGWSGVANDKRDHFSQVRTNLYGSLDFLQLCLENGCHTWIGIGSQAEYGSTNEILDEDLVPKPDSLYGLVKLCVGLQSLQMCEKAGARPVWLRLTAAYGPKDDPNHLIPYVIKTLLEGEEPALTAGEQKWDYLYIDDVIQAIWCAIEKTEVSGIYNLSSGNGVAVREICELIRSQIETSLPLGFGKVPAAPGARHALVAQNTRFRRAAGWEPLTNLDQGIHQTVDWYSQAVK
jgi:nucleoside-diphosphate-sugar epimerase